MGGARAEVPGCRCAMVGHYMVTVKQMALNMRRAKKGKSASIRRKQKKSAMSNDSLEQGVWAGTKAANK